MFVTWSTSCEISNLKKLKNLPLEGLCDKDPPAPAEEHIYKLKSICLTVGN